jgi:hypothetical protein
VKALFLLFQCLIDVSNAGTEAAKGKASSTGSNAMLSRWFEKLEILFMAVTFAEAGEFETAILIAERAR